MKQHRGLRRQEARWREGALHRETDREREKERERERGRERGGSLTQRDRRKTKAQGMGKIEGELGSEGIEQADRGERQHSFIFTDGDGAKRDEEKRRRGGHVFFTLTSSMSTGREREREEEK